MTAGWEVILLALLLGVRHAFDADHLVAITAIVSEYRNPLRAAWVGISWGLGHTTVLLLLGGVLLFSHIHVPETFSYAVELLVGLMLVILGVQTLLFFRRHTLHAHQHTHVGAVSGVHQHFHFHGKATGGVHHELGQAGKVIETKPFFRPKSFIVGLVNGLGGSAALMLLGLTSISSFWGGVIYVLVFGLGSVVAMGMLSALISLPFSVSGRMPTFHPTIKAGAGILSIAFGLVVVFQTLIK